MGISRKSLYYQGRGYLMGSSSSLNTNKNIYSSTRARKIKLGGFIYELRFIDEDADMPHGHEARILEAKQEIIVSGGSKVHGERILHECVHGIDWQVDGEPSERPENYTRRFSYALYAFLRDNPELIIRMIAEDRGHEIVRKLRRLADEIEEIAVDDQIDREAAEFQEK